MDKEKVLSFDELNLRFGQIIQILPNPKNSAEQCDALIVGCLPGDAFILSAPQDTGLFPHVEEGQKVGIRVMSSNGVALFLTTILYVSDVPAYMVYLDIPSKVTFHVVRGSTRVDVSLPVLVSSSDDVSIRGISATVLDISVGGARVYADKSLGDIGSEIEITGKFQVGSIKRLLRIKAILCNKKPAENSGAYYGVTFNDGDEDNLIVLFGFIFNSMAFSDVQLIS